MAKTAGEVAPGPRGPRPRQGSGGDGGGGEAGATVVGAAAPPPHPTLASIGRSRTFTIEKEPEPTPAATVGEAASGGGASGGRRRLLRRQQQADDSSSSDADSGLTGTVGKVLLVTEAEVHEPPAHRSPAPRQDGGGASSRRGSVVVLDEITHAGPDEDITKPEDADADVAGDDAGRRVLGDIEEATDEPGGGGGAEGVPDKAGGALGSHEPGPEPGDAEDARTAGDGLQGTDAAAEQGAADQVTTADDTPAADAEATGVERDVQDGTDGAVPDDDVAEGAVVADTDVQGAEPEQPSVRPGERAADGEAASTAADDSKGVEPPGRDQQSGARSPDVAAAAGRPPTTAPGVTLGLPATNAGAAEAEEEEEKEEEEAAAVAVAQQEEAEAEEEASTPTGRTLHEMDEATRERLQQTVTRMLEEREHSFTSREALRRQMDGSAALLAAFYAAPSADAGAVLEQGELLLQRLRRLRGETKKFSLCHESLEFWSRWGRSTADLT
ncbi:hypothetical protein ONE63_007415 [Megalurothrips usitatus]|uniref:Uncharacterized protein n=1 Tax=Megalurothrips usitatus TaxID=439358 RepID=A0AAV7XMN7_9NEOP|nr:hypothetical protein ONE63_007415 [Megalurothrips usitatus]